MKKTPKPGYLIPRIAPNENEVFTCAILYNELNAELEYLTKKLKEHSSEIGKICCSGYLTWALQLKRYKIPLDPKNPTSRITAVYVDIIELINQCANLRRLCDVLKWFAESETYKNFTVVVCHPTQSQKNDECDLDLKQGNTMVHIEVTDTSGSGCPSKLENMVKKFRSIKTDENHEYYVVAPYEFVKTVSDPAIANMRFGNIKSFPIMRMMTTWQYISVGDYPTWLIKLPETLDRN